MEKDKIKKISELTSESAWAIKKILGMLPEVDYSQLSLLDLKVAYKDADDKSEEEAGLYEELSKRVFAEISSKSLERVRDAYFLAKELCLDSLAIKAFDFWEDIAWQEIVAADDYDKLKLACQRTPRISRAYSFALEKKEVFLARELEEAKTIEDYQKIFKKAFVGSQARNIAIQKMAKMLEETSK